MAQGGRHMAKHERTMTTRSRWLVLRRLVLAGTVVVDILAGPARDARASDGTAPPPNYALTILGELSGDNGSRPEAINNRSQIVGGSYFLDNNCPPGEHCP